MIINPKNKQYKILFKIATFWVIATFFCQNVTLAEIKHCYLASPSFAKKPEIKREIYAALLHRRVIYAESEYAKSLLKANNANALLLSSGKYLVTKEVAQDDLSLLRAIIHEDIEALMQIMAKEDRYRYQGIKELILPQKKVIESYYNLFPIDKKPDLPWDLLLNDIVARAFELIILLEKEMVSPDEILLQELTFIETIRPIIMAYRHNYFTSEFWSSREREEKIRVALNQGIMFHQVTNTVNDKEAHRERLKVAIERSYKAIAVDIDGTIKKPSLPIDESILHKLIQYLKSGGVLILATSRDDSSIKRVFFDRLDEVGIALSDDLCRRIFICAENGTNVYNYYEFQQNNKKLLSLSLGIVTETLLKTVRDIILKPFIDRGELSPEDIFVTDYLVQIKLGGKKNRNSKEISEFLKEYLSRMKVNFQIIRSKHRIDITNANGSKMDGVTAIGEYLGIDMLEIAKIGDQLESGGNDSSFDDEASFSVGSYKKESPYQISLGLAKDLQGPAATSWLLDNLKFAALNEENLEILVNQDTPDVTGIIDRIMDYFGKPFPERTLNDRISLLSSIGIENPDDFIEKEAVRHREKNHRAKTEQDKDLVYEIVRSSGIDYLLDPFNPDLRIAYRHKKGASRPNSKIAIPRINRKVLATLFKIKFKSSGIEKALVSFLGLKSDDFFGSGGEIVSLKIQDYGTNCVIKLNIRHPDVSSNQPKMLFLKIDSWRCINEFGERYNNTGMKGYLREGRFNVSHAPFMNFVSQRYGLNIPEAYADNLALIAESGGKDYVYVIDDINNEIRRGNMEYADAFLFNAGENNAFIDLYALYDRVVTLKELGDKKPPVGGQYVVRYIDGKPVFVLIDYDWMFQLDEFWRRFSVFGRKDPCRLLGELDIFEGGKNILSADTTDENLARWSRAVVSYAKGYMELWKRMEKDKDVLFEKIQDLYYGEAFNRCREMLEKTPAESDRGEIISRLFDELPRTAKNIPTLQGFMRTSWFRVGEIKKLESFKEKIKDRKGVLYSYFAKAGYASNDEIDNLTELQIVRILNEHILKQPTFFDNNQIDLSVDLQKYAAESSAIRNREFSMLSSDDQAKIIKLNRKVLEHIYKDDIRTSENLPYYTLQFESNEEMIREQDRMGHFSCEHEEARIQFVESCRTLSLNEIAEAFARLYLIRVKEQIQNTLDNGCEKMLKEVFRHYLLGLRRRQRKNPSVKQENIERFQEKALNTIDELFHPSATSLSENMRLPAILIMGYPGAGKSSVAKELAEKLNIPYLSKGDVLRVMHKKHPEIEDIPKHAVEMMSRYIQENSIDLSRGIIIDWNARYAGPIELPQDFFDKHGLSLSAVIYLEVDAETAKGRLIRRGRKTDLKRIDYRIKQHEEVDIPLLERYDERGLVLRVPNGEGVKLNDVVSDAIKRLHEKGILSKIKAVIINKKFQDDIEFATILLSSLLYAQIQEDRIYEIRYDSSRLSESQQDIIKAYIEVLKTRVSNSDNIVAKPFRGVKKNYIIKIVCKGAHEQIIGEGQINVEGEDELGIYPLRIIGMINIALAVSNIPNKIITEQLEEYRPLIDFIKNQYKAITGKELDIPNSLDELLAIIRKINLPKPERMDLNEINRLNILAKQLLISA